MRDHDWWERPAGQEVTHILQEHYYDIILAFKEYGFVIRNSNPEKSEYYSNLADELYRKKPDAPVVIIAE